MGVNHTQLGIVLLVGLLHQVITYISMYNPIRSCVLKKACVAPQNGFWIMRSFGESFTTAAVT